MAPNYVTLDTLPQQACVSHKTYRTWASINANISPNSRFEFIRPVYQADLRAHVVGKVEFNIRRRPLPCCSKPEESRIKPRPKANDLFRGCLSIAMAKKRLHQFIKSCHSSVVP